jgi:Flp pilus assembly protein TadG
MEHSHLDERGESSVQTVVLVPIVFLLAFMCFHIGSILHQTHVAQVAAIRGATIASALNQSAESNHQARLEVMRVVSDLDSELAFQPSIIFRDSGVQVKVTLKTSTALSFLPSTASAEAWRPFESFRLEQQRR